jgi:hypothetical protein
MRNAQPIGYNAESVANQYEEQIDTLKYQEFQNRIDMYPSDCSLADCFLMINTKLKAISRKIYIPPLVLIKLQDIFFLDTTGCDQGKVEDVRIDFSYTSIIQIPESLYIFFPETTRYFFEGFKVTNKIAAVLSCLLCSRVKSELLS